MLAQAWSARKWIATIMIGWGTLAAFTGLIRSSMEFNAIRFLLGLAEGGFFPAVVVYLTHWFRQEDRAKAVAMFMAAIPVSNAIGAPIAGLLLGIHRLGLSGWRWLLILVGIVANRHFPSTRLAKDTHPVTAPAANVASADVGMNDDDLLQEVADRSPVMKAQYQDNLRRVNEYILDAQSTVDANPDDAEARRSLMEAYQQKAMLFEMAMDRSLP